MLRRIGTKQPDGGSIAAPKCIGPVSLLTSRSHRRSTSANFSAEASTEESTA